jgi:pyridinium-3,5-biscarboxylic acid mononucleotide synthase
MNDSSQTCNLGFARLDFNREKRRGYPEAVFCPGKTPEHLEKISREFIRRKQDLLLTKLSKEAYLRLAQKVPAVRYHEAACLGYVRGKKKKTKKGLVVVICAGTGDIPVAHEACLTAELMGSRVRKVFDVGVAGVHRIMEHMRLVRSASVVIVVAGMEGALASLVSGLVKAPVVAVPTSCGYGSSFGGLAALLTMLNSCSPGVAVVNIDNGFGAGYLAHIINQ